MNYKDAICISPFKEIKMGSESIYDYCEKGYSVPEQVIAYLKTAKPFIMSPGIYQHPFRPEIELLGPYTYTDGKYFWDRDMWKYIVKYHVTVPQKFIEHVLSDEGKRFMEQCIEEPKSWSDVINQMKKKKGVLCFLPEDAGDIGLEDF